MRLGGLSHLVAKPRHEVVDTHGDRRNDAVQTHDAKGSVKRLLVRCGVGAVWVGWGVLNAIKITQAVWGSTAREVCAAPQRGSCAEAWCHPHRHTACAGST